MVFVVYNRRRESHIKYPGPDDDVRENIINYDDEGGGEDDMTAFDITPLQIPIGGPIPEMGGKLPPCKIPCKSFLFFSSFFIQRSILDGIFQYLIIFRYARTGAERGHIYRGSQKESRQRSQRATVRRSSKLRVRGGRKHRRLIVIVSFRYVVFVTKKNNSFYRINSSLLLVIISSRIFE